MSGPPGVTIVVESYNLAEASSIDRLRTTLEGFPEELWPGEDTVVTFRLGQTGRLAFTSHARYATPVGRRSAGSSTTRGNSEPPSPRCARAWTFRIGAWPGAATRR